MELEQVNSYLDSFAACIGGAGAAGTGELKTGVDLGTANICLAVLGEKNEPVTGELYPASVVRDGLVFDYVGSVAIVRELKDRIERRLGRPLTRAAAAIPPGTVGRNAEVVSHVVEAAGLQVVNVVDEPTAAASALGVTDGAVVDVGGGTTGVSILKDGRVIAVQDEPTGGSHMTLVIAGNYGIPMEEAEARKLNPANHGEIFPLIRPVIEKMATIVKNFIRGYEVETVYVAGGAACFDGFEDVFEKECGVRTIKPRHGLLITPLGIAMHSTGRAG